MRSYILTYSVLKNQGHGMGLTLSRSDLNICVHGTPPQKQVDDMGEGGGREGLWEEREERESHLRLQHPSAFYFRV